MRERSVCLFKNCTENSCNITRYQQDRPTRRQTDRQTNGTRWSFLCTASAETAIPPLQWSFTTNRAYTTCVTTPGLSPCHCAWLCLGWCMKEICTCEWPLVSYHSARHFTCGLMSLNKIVPSSFRPCAPSFPLQPRFSLLFLSACAARPCSTPLCLFPPGEHVRECRVTSPQDFLCCIRRVWFYWCGSITQGMLWHLITWHFSWYFATVMKKNCFLNAP